TTFTNLSNGSGVARATSTTLTVSGFTTAGSPEYRAIVKDANGATATSNAATLTINAAPSITQPQNAVATVGQSASESFTIADNGGTTPLVVQWQISTNNGVSFTNLSNGTGVAGATSTTLTVSGFSTAGSREYRAIVTDANNVSATSNAATLTINSVPSPATPNQKWLAQVYADFFNRAVDASGMKTWIDLLNQGGSRAQ